jgi:internalin A
METTRVERAIQESSRHRILNLSDKKLIEFPDIISRLTYLVKIYLHTNKISSLPEIIGDLSNLTSLDLHNNELTSLPESIGRLTI